jgi:hypothetical protein
LRARGNIEVDCAWANGKATIATLRVNADSRIQLAAPQGQYIQRITCLGKEIPLRSADTKSMSVELREGSQYRVTFA